MPPTTPAAPPRRVVDLAQALVRFDTSNPPGNERDCLRWVADLLAAAGVRAELVGAAADRPNLVARLPGRGDGPPLLLTGHVDVVPARACAWSQPPFGGRIADGCLWGRGALDMKGGVAMLLDAFLRAAAEGPPPVDLVLCLVADEEAGGGLGAGWLVEHRPDLLAGVRFALGELGGFSLPLFGRRFYPIQVAEKQRCWLRATVRGPGGHGSVPVAHGAATRLGQLLVALGSRRLPVHVTPATSAMLDAIAAALPPGQAELVRALLEPEGTDQVLDDAGDAFALFDPLLHHTVSATVVRAGEQTNVIPDRATVELDGRLLPGFAPADLEAELRARVGDAVHFDLLAHEPGPPEPDLSLLPLLCDVLRDADPGGVPVPFLMPGFSDARHLARLGIQTYGFLPMPLPEDLALPRLVHGADERVPVAALEFGARCLTEVIARAHDPDPRRAT